MSNSADPRGSIWRRWDPHVHTPGTVLNDQFGADAWDEYLTRIEKSAPRIEVLGVTDYASLDRYEDVLKSKTEGRLPDVAMIFPNVELRLPLLTKANKPVNIHLLFSPEDADHVERARGFLRGLKFTYQGEQYSCANNDLMRLGRMHAGVKLENKQALEAGTNQFKVTPESLRTALDNSAWARKNVIIAVAGSGRDGSSGLQDNDGSMQATRSEIEAMCGAIFTSQPSQRAFWLGRGAATPQVLQKKWNGLKACIHGSDAHELAKVGVPDEGRMTWIKGDPTFEALRQACIEPAERVIVDVAPPTGALEYQTIDRVLVANASWLKTPDIPLNRGLVAIIGARGSGKTALADLIAAATDAATPARASLQSFIHRAAPLLTGSTVRLNWADGSESATTLPPLNTSDEPAVQYLSQQFVERLCSAEGMTDELLAEVERVVFEAHEVDSRMGATDFNELLDIVASPSRAKRERADEENRRIAEQLRKEREDNDSLKPLQEQMKELKESLKADKAARSSLIVKGGEARAKRLEQVNEAAAHVRKDVDRLSRRETSLNTLRDAVTELRDRRLPELTAALERDHSDALLSDTQWDHFTIEFKTDPSSIVTAELAAAQKQRTKLVGSAPTPPSGEPENVPPFIKDGADLSSLSLKVLQAEAWRLGKLIGLDKDKAAQLANLNKKIETAEGDLAKLAARITKAEGAAARIKALQKRRTENYASLFDGYTEEQQQLENLYEPLKAILGDEAGTLGKLSFIVRRTVDLEGWANQGESLLDLRSAGPFRGHGELLGVAEHELRAAWTHGAAKDVAIAMTNFRAAHDADLMASAKVPRTDNLEYRKWAAAVSEWLNSTDHISIQYSVQYDGVDIEQLSPGTRGIVLLLLYLSLDKSDDRPLIIDQPEENLDPKSIFDELVERFRDTRHRRQIIIVTHNANLVVNTDADQVIVAKAGRHRPGNLPKITYLSGSLENPAIRKQVCKILEGGKKAFEARAKRLRITLK